MITELISVGTEILLGNIVNTNSAYLSEKCAELGLSVYYQTVVGDNETRMRETIQTALDRSDIVILTGGLGPTEDDLTKKVTAEVMGMKLVEDRHSRKLMEAYLEQYKKNNPQRKITANNYKQAMVPKGAIVLDNHNGTWNRIHAKCKDTLNNFYCSKLSINIFVLQYIIFFTFSFLFNGLTSF